MSVIHGLKVLTKEDFAPTGADIDVFTLAPVVTFMASVMTLLVIPFAPGLFGLDLNIGLLYFFAMGGLTVVGLLMAGWSSFNKYSLLGGLRSAAEKAVKEKQGRLSGHSLTRVPRTRGEPSSTRWQWGRSLQVLKMFPRCICS